MNKSIFMVLFAAALAVSLVLAPVLSGHANIGLVTAQTPIPTPTEDISTGPYHI